MEHINILSYAHAEEFRTWLAEHAQTEKECWLVLQRGKPVDTNVFYYLDAVEEALCFGWIDGTLGLVNGVRMQRFSPRREGSAWTELNKERARRLEKTGRMTAYGRRVLPNLSMPFVLHPVIEQKIRAENLWETFLAFPPLYQRVRGYNLAFSLTKLPDSFPKAWENFVKHTRNGETYGEWNDYGRLLSY